MSNRNTMLIIIITGLLAVIAYWFYKNQPYEETEPTEARHYVQEPAYEQEMTPELIQEDTDDLERQIEQIKVDQRQPEVTNLQNLLEEFEEDNNKWDNVIAIGDIYRRGAYPRFLPNEELAARCFKIAAMCPNGVIAGLGQSKFIETRDDPIESIDKKGEHFPKIYGEQICEIAESTIKTTPWHMFEKPRAEKNKVIKEPTAPTFNLNALNAFNFEELEDVTWINNLQENRFDFNEDDAVPQIVPQYRIDSQNVHDHGVAKVTQFNINNLKDSSDSNKSVSDSKIQEIKNAIAKVKDVSDQTKKDALHVIDNLTELNHSSFDTTEKNALGMVWDNINKQNSDLKDNLTETLTKQLASGVEHGHVVCSTGKISRIMGTLDGVSNVVARPTWALRDEMSNLAIKIRKEATEKYGDTPAAGTHMQKEFEAQIKEEYIYKLGMSEKIIMPMIEEYASGF